MIKLNMLTLATATVLCLGSFSSARADETVKFRLMMHATSVQTQEVGDVDGHVVGVGRYSGLVSFSDGSVGTANFTFSNDYIKGNGTYTTYYHVSFRDGSTITYKITNAPARLDGSVTNFPEAPISILRGTGRFEGAKGDGTAIGARLTPLAAGAELYSDVTLNLKK
jgi:hypothetical protein